MKNILEWVLKLLAKSYIWRYKPRIIGITGSVGKTSTKEAIALALSANFKIWASDKSYNNQIGLPLTILGQKTAGKNVWAWFLLILKAKIGIIYKKDYPQILVLEMGSDRIGDLKYLTGIVKPNISVVTSVSPVHLEFFKNLKNIAKEKLTLVKVLKKDDWAIFNYDDKNVRQMADKTKAKNIFYGFLGASNVQGETLNFKKDRTKFSIKYKNEKFNFSIRGLNRGSAYSLLAAFSVGIVLGVKPKVLAQNLANFKILSGRGRILEGEDGNLIIDESYNSSPIALKSSLDYLKQMQTDKNKIVILGEMRELGILSYKYHQDLAKGVDFADKIILVGEGTKSTYDLLHKDKRPVYFFKNVQELISGYPKLSFKKSIILVKGSQGVRLEKFIAKIIKPKYNLKEVLVRQSEEWQ